MQRYAHEVFRGTFSLKLMGVLIRVFKMADAIMNIRADETACVGAGKGMGNRREQTGYK